MRKSARKPALATAAPARTDPFEADVLNALNAHLAKHPGEPGSRALIELVRALYLDASAFYFETLEPLDPAERKPAGALMQAKLAGSYSIEAWENAYRSCLKFENAVAGDAERTSIPLSAEVSEQPTSSLSIEPDPVEKDAPIDSGSLLEPAASASGAHEIADFDDTPIAIDERAPKDMADTKPAPVESPARKAKTVFLLALVGTLLIAALVLALPIGPSFRGSLSEWGAITFLQQPAAPAGVSYAARESHEQPGAEPPGKGSEPDREAPSAAREAETAAQGSKAAQPSHAGAQGKAIESSQRGIAAVEAVHGEALRAEELGPSAEAASPSRTELHALKSVEGGRADLGTECDQPGSQGKCDSSQSQPTLTQTAQQASALPVQLAAIAVSPPGPRGRAATLIDSAPAKPRITSPAVNAVRDRPERKTQTSALPPPAVLNQTHSALSNSAGRTQETLSATVDKTTQSAANVLAAAKPVLTDTTRTAVESGNAVLDVAKSTVDTTNNTLGSAAQSTVDHAKAALSSVKTTLGNTAQDATETAQAAVGTATGTADSALKSTVHSTSQLLNSVVSANANGREPLAKPLASIQQDVVKTLEPLRNGDSKTGASSPRLDRSAINIPGVVERGDTATSGLRPEPVVRTAVPEKAGRVDLPKIELPKAEKIERVELPKIEKVDVPKVEKVERIELPKVEKVERVELPKIEKIERVELPKVEKVERVELPKIEKVERVEVTRIEVPKVERIEVPRVELPKIERVEVPRVEIPKVERVEVPRVELPKIERVEVPKIEKVQRVELPKIELPRIDRIEVPEKKGK